MFYSVEISSPVNAPYISKYPLLNNSAFPATISIWVFSLITESFINCIASSDNKALTASFLEILILKSSLSIDPLLELGIPSPISEFQTSSPKTNSIKGFSNKGDLNSEIDNLSESISNNQNLNFSLRDRSKTGAYLLLRGNFKSDDRTQDAANRTIYLDENENEDKSKDDNEVEIEIVDGIPLYIKKERKEK